MPNFLNMRLSFLRNPEQPMEAIKIEWFVYLQWKTSDVKESLNNNTPVTEKAYHALTIMERLGVSVNFGISTAEIVRFSRSTLTLAQILSPASAVPFFHRKIFSLSLALSDRRLQTTNEYQRLPSLSSHTIAASHWQL